MTDTEFIKLKQKIYKEAEDRLSYGGDLSFEELETLSRVAWNLKEEDTDIKHG